MILVLTYEYVRNGRNVFYCLIRQQRLNKIVDWLTWCNRHRICSKFDDISKVAYIDTVNWSYDTQYHYKINPECVVKDGSRTGTSSLKWEN